MEGIQLKKIVRSYDVRGLFPSEINEEKAHLLTRGFLSYLKTKKLLIGYDSRPSGIVLFSGVLQACKKSGVQPIILGMCTTPEFQWSCINQDTPGIIITASHNPKEYNGMKFYNKYGDAIGKKQGLEKVRIITEEKKFITGKPKEILHKNLAPYYSSWLARQAPTIKGTYVVDISNGTAGIVLQYLMKKIHPDFKIIDEIPDGNFPGHSPNPLAHNATKAISSKVRTTKAKAGFVYDGDADRILMVDEKGTVVHPNHLTALIISKMEPNKIVIDSSCSKIVEEIANKKKHKIIKSEVGRNNLLAKMKENRAKFGGESSGHYFHKEANYSDNATLTMLKAIEIIEKENKPASLQLEEFRKYEILDIELKGKTIVDVKKKLKNFSVYKELDGYKFSRPGVWGFFRESNTEPLVRIRIEGVRIQDVKEIAKKIK